MNGRFSKNAQLHLFLAGIGHAWLLAGCATTHNHAALPVADPGKILFASYCAACHLSNGPGMAAEAPPLDGSPWVKGPGDRLVKIVVQGLRGAVEIGGKTYNQEMPAVGQSLTDDQVASLLSFVRRQFGGASVPMPSSAVSRVRAASGNRSGYWTVGELLKEP